MRRAAILLHTCRKTIERKLAFLSAQGLLEHARFLSEIKQAPLESMQFDEMETSEHSKLKPLSIALAVDDKERKILGFEVSVMPASGHLAQRSIRKYGFRPDERVAGLRKLFEEIKPCLTPQAIIQSDEKLMYMPQVREYFPEAKHVRSKGRKPCVVGQGELKSGGFDPLFMLNHTCAMFRANVNRLFRRTWCTTKKKERLVQHLILYMNYHNQVLT